MPDFNQILGEYQNSSYNEAEPVDDNDFIKRYHLVSKASQGIQTQSAKKSSVKAKEQKVYRQNLIRSVVSFSEIIDVGDKYKSLVKMKGKNQDQRNNNSQTAQRLPNFSDEEIEVNNYHDNKDIQEKNLKFITQ